MLGGHLFPEATVRSGGRLLPLPGLALSLAFAPIEVAMTLLRRPCIFNLTARRP